MGRTERRLKDRIAEHVPKWLGNESHTLNLVASTDVLREIQQNNSQLRFQFRKTMGKAQALWNAQGRSTQAADMIKTEIGRKLIVPNVTRWNSTYDSVNLLCELFDDGKRQAVNKVMLNLKKPLEPFNADDVTFLKEYAKVMAPIAKSLDKLQGEEDAYLGVLLPTIAITLRYGSWMTSRRVFASVESWLTPSKQL